MKCASVLTVALLTVLAGCEAPARSSEYFKAHPEEARTVLDECAADTVRGDECTNARMGAMQAERLEALAEDAARREAADARGRSGKILPTFRKR